MEAGGPLGVDLDEDGRAAATLDADGDGDLDLVVFSLQSLRLLRNEQPPGRHFARIRLRATKGEPHALGAVVSLTAGGRTQVERVRLVAGFHTQHSTEVHLGLGAATGIERLEVRWPSGTVQRFADLPVDRRLAVVEGRDRVEALEIPSWAADTRPAIAQRYSLDVPVLGLDGQGARLVDLVGTGRPALINFWGPNCAPCVRETPALVGLARRYRDQVRVVGVSVERHDPAEVRTFIGQHGVNYPVVLATDEALRAFFGPLGRALLPTTFLFDAKGRLRRVFRREVTAAEVSAFIDEAQRPTTPDDYWELALRLAQGAGKARAHQVMAAAVTAHPGDVVTWRRYAEVLLAANQGELALKAIDQALEVDPKAVGALADRAQILSISGQSQEGWTMAQKALRLEPGNARALTAAGVISWILGDRQGAQQYLTAALEVDPYYTPAQRSLARAQDPDEVPGLPGRGRAPGPPGGGQHHPHDH